MLLERRARALVAAAMATCPDMRGMRPMVMYKSSHVRLQFSWQRDCFLTGLLQRSPAPAPLTLPGLRAGQYNWRLVSTTATPTLTLPSPRTRLVGSGT